MNRKKAGQPSDPMELTAGRSTLLRQLFEGVADREGMAMAANWMRDITGKNVKPPAPIYTSLMEGTATTLEEQRNVAHWIASQCNITIVSGQGLRMTKTSKANDHQPGGDHYKKRTIQHWDFVSDHGYSYLPGQITKYLSRYPDKGGLLDIQKALHFLEKAIEVAETEEVQDIPLADYLDAQGITNPIERSIHFMIHAYHLSHDVQFLRMAHTTLEEYTGGMKPPTE